jgi:hypothetical protein
MSTPEPMTRVASEIARAFIEAGRGFGLGTALQVMDELDWLRHRIIGDRSDIERTGVTLAMCAAYALAKNVCQGAGILSSINVLACVRNLCFLDTLDEIMALDAETTEQL